MKKKWYENWFNEDYQLIYSHRNENEINDIIRLFEKFGTTLNNKTVLDICCGLGRLSYKLASKAESVHAFDLSEYFIDTCLANNCNDNLKFSRFDMREMKYSNMFDGIFQIFTSFGYFDSKEENFNVLHHVYRALKVNGYYLFDFFNSEWVKTHLQETTEFEDNSYRIVQYREIVDLYVKKHISILKKNTSEENEYIERVMLISKSEFDQEFEKIGFKIVKLFGDYDGHDFDDINSPRLIYLLQKK